jgi:hypothetical protein
MHPGLLSTTTPNVIVATSFVDNQPHLGFGLLPTTPPNLVLFAASEGDTSTTPNGAQLASITAGLAGQFKPGAQHLPRRAKALPTTPHYSDVVSPFSTDPSPPLTNHYVITHYYITFKAASSSHVSGLSQPAPGSRTKIPETPSFGEGVRWPLCHRRCINGIPVWTGPRLDTYAVEYKLDLCIKKKDASGRRRNN